MMLGTTNIKKMYRRSSYHYILALPEWTRIWQVRAWGNSLCNRKIAMQYPHFCETDNLLCNRKLPIIVTDDQKDATFLAYLLIPIQLYMFRAMFSSSDVFAHHQEHLTVFSASDIVHIYCCRLVSRMRVSWISSMTPAGSNIGGKYQQF